MQTITKAYQVYKYEELSDSAKEKVNCEFGQEDGQFETDCLTDDFGEQLIEKYPYFLKPEFQWSCSSSQGDGLSFSCDIDVSVFLDKEFPTLKQSLKDIIVSELNIKSKGNTGRYCYASESDIECSYLHLDSYEHIEKLTSVIIDAITEKYTDACHEFYMNACKSYEYLYTDEYAQETCDGNEYTFLEDGTMFNE